MQGAQVDADAAVTSQAIKLVAKKVKKGKLGADRTEELDALLEKKERPTGSTSKIPFCGGRKVDTISWASASACGCAGLTLAQRTRSLRPTASSTVTAATSSRSPPSARPSSCFTVRSTRAPSLAERC